LAYLKRAVQGTDYAKLPLLSAAAPFKAGGRQGTGSYTDIPKGPLAIKNVADLYVFPNTIKAVKINGAQVREWLEMSAGQFRRIDPAGAPEQELLNPEFRSYNFDSLEGVSYEIDVTQPARYDVDGHRNSSAAAHRIVNLRYQGQAIDEQTDFLVITNNYRASGGGGFPGLDASKIVIDAPDENRAALAQYLASAKQFNPTANGNWRVLPVAGVKLRFVSGAGGLRYLANTPQITLVQERADGSALYQLNP
jgi:2',3'-cyclic-nucleotide 2'-phosphodiesterase/3'-nucleotidase